MIFYLTIQCDNEAFRNPGEEVGRILRTLNIALSGGRGMPGDPVELTDLKGNQVGSAEFFDASHNPQLPLLVEMTEEEADAVANIIIDLLDQTCQQDLEPIPNVALANLWVHQRLRNVFPLSGKGS